MTMKIIGVFVLVIFIENSSSELFSKGDTEAAWMKKMVKNLSLHAKREPQNGTIRSNRTHWTDLFMKKVYKLKTEVMNSNFEYLETLLQSGEFDNETLNLMIESDVVMISRMKEEKLRFELSVDSEKSLRLLKGILNIYTSQVSKNDSQFTVRVFTDGFEASQVFRGDFEGWLQLDVSALLSKWQQTSQGGEMKVEVISNFTTVQRPGDFGLVLTNESPVSPFVVVYWDELDGKPGVTLDELTSRVTRGKRSAEDDADETPTCEELKNLPGVCCRQKYQMNVDDFKELEHIVEPRTINNYFCTGTCSEVELILTGFRGPYLQYLAYRKNKTEIPKPTCTASKSEPFSILWDKGDGHYMHIIMQEVIVKKCSCG